MREHVRSAESHDSAASDEGTAGKSARTARLQRKASGVPAGGDASGVVEGLAGSSGSPLPDGVRDRFEGSLGSDLSGVRLHTGGDSAAAAEQLGARAFTTGQDIHFGAGQYQPDDPYGMHLVAHEVAHTVQQGQGGGGAQHKLEVSTPDDPLEHEADRAADAMVSGAPAMVSAGSAAAARKVHRSEAAAGGSPTGAPAPEGAGAAPATARPTLRVGSRGPAVEELQRALAAAGHACAVDGQFGPATRAAVIAFQQAKGLGADGVVGPLTWGAIGVGGAAAEAPAEAPASGGATPAAPAGGANPATPAAGAGASPAAPAPATGGANQAAPAAGHTGAAPAGPDAGGGDAPAPPASDNPTRAAIVAAARSKIGTVFSDVPGDVIDGEKTRKGWETLTEIFDVGFPSFPKQIIKFMKYGKNNGKAGSNPNGLVSWCGVFATWAVITGGGSSGTWLSGDRVSNFKKRTSDPKPGDVGYFDANQHHCIIAAVDGDRVETIDGNSYDTDGGGNGAITSRWRSRGDFQAFFKQVND